MCAAKGVTYKTVSEYSTSHFRQSAMAFTIFNNQGDDIMENNSEEHAYNINRTKNVIIGLLLGGLAGAVAMLLFAPQSGKRTRVQIQQESILLRDRTTKNVKKAVAQVRSETNRITAEVQGKAGELKQLGQEKLVEQLDRMSAALDAGKTAVEAA
jgi:gas vesicle protein